MNSTSPPEYPGELEISKHYHMRLCVRGALRNQMFGGLQHNDGRPMSRDEAFNALCDCLKAGKEYVPVRECDNFDEEKGCQGHPKQPATDPFPDPTPSGF